MSNRKTSEAAGEAHARARQRPTRLKARLTDKIAIACPPGTRDRIEAAAEADDMTPAEWLRAALRAALEAARKRQERAAAKGAAK